MALRFTTAGGSHGPGGAAGAAAVAARRRRGKPGAPAGAGWGGSPMALRFTTAGESHGPGLTAVLEGLPAGLQMTPEDIPPAVERRVAGHPPPRRVHTAQ